MQQKKTIKTNYMATKKNEFVIQIPKLIGHEIIEVISEFAKKKLKKSEYAWDNEKGILIIKTKEGIIGGEILNIESFVIEVPSDPTEERPEP